MIQAHVTTLLAVLLVGQVQGIRFHLEPNGHKCLKEEVHANVLVTGEYEVTEAMGQKTNYVVGRSRLRRDVPAGVSPNASC